MSEKNFAVVGTFADDGNPNTVTVPSSTDEIIAKLDEIAAKYQMGEVLSEEDNAIVKAYLPAIGADESSISADGALVGGGRFAFDRSELGCDVHAEGLLSCEGVGEGRIQLWTEMHVKKTGGDTEVLGYRFAFQGVGFGVGPTGAMKVIYKRNFAREFGAAESAVASFCDRYTLAQWGFYYTAQCDLVTSKGIVTIK